jgi:hypothetical protein
MLLEPVYRNKDGNDDRGNGKTMYEMSDDLVMAKSRVEQGAKTTMPDMQMASHQSSARIVFLSSGGYMFQRVTDGPFAASA